MAQVDATNVDTVFSYHRPKDGQPERYERIREAAREFVKVLLADAPASADRTTAIRHVRDAVMTANAAVALDGLI